MIARNTTLGRWKEPYSAYLTRLFSTDAPMDARWTKKKNIVPEGDVVSLIRSVHRVGYAETGRVGAARHHGGCGAPFSAPPKAGTEALRPLRRAPRFHF